MSFMPQKSQSQPNGSSSVHRSTLSRVTSASSSFIPPPASVTASVNRLTTTEMSNNTNAAILRPGEHRLRANRSPSLVNPRSNLQDLFSADSTDSLNVEASYQVQRSYSTTSLLSASRSSLTSNNLSANDASRRSVAVTPVGMGAGRSSIFAGLTGRTRLTTVDSSPGNDSSSKKRKVESLSPLNSAESGKTGIDIVRLEAENSRLKFECESAKKILESERLLMEESLRKKKKADDDYAAKTNEMWSEATKMVKENEILRERLQKAELDAIADRKKYEDQIAEFRLKHLQREKELEESLRESRTKNIGLDERIRTLTHARDTLSEENRILSQNREEVRSLNQEVVGLKSELHDTRQQLQASQSRVHEHESANVLAANLPDEIRQLRELQMSVPILKKEVERLRQRAVDARCNEDRVKQLQEENGKLQERLQKFYEMEIELDRLRDQLTDYNASDDATQMSPRRVPPRIQKLMDDIAMLTEERDSALADAQRHLEEIGKLKQKSSVMETRNTEISGELASVKNRVARLEQELKEKNTSLISTQMERDTLKLIKETMDSSSTRRPESLQKLRDLEERVNKFQTLAMDFERAYEETKKKLEEAEEELKQVQDRYNSEVVNNQKTVRDLTEEIDALKKSLAEGNQTAAAFISLSDLQIFTLEESPLERAQKQRLEEAESIREENRILQEKLNQIRASGGTSASDLTMNVEEFLKGPGEQIEDLKKQLEKSEKQRANDMKSFQKTSSNFRTVIKQLLGWNVRYDTNKVTFRLADGSTTDTIVFEREDENSAWELRPTDFATANTAVVEEFLRNHHSPPGFFARIILQVLSERTLICFGASVTP